MNLKSKPDELIEELRELAEIGIDEGRVAFVNGKMQIGAELKLDELTESDAADFIESVAKFLQAIVDEGGPHAAQAKRILERLE